MGVGALCRAVTLGTLVMIGTAGSAQQGANGPLARLQPGRWQVRDLDAPSSPPTSFCMADPHVLVQLEHRGASCSQIVIGKDSRSLTVHYTCAAEGFGQTTVKTISPSVARVETQGIAHGRPFNYRAEARRAGVCRR